MSICPIHRLGTMYMYTYEVYIHHNAYIHVYVILWGKYKQECLHVVDMGTKAIDYSVAVRWFFYINGTL